MVFAQSRVRFHLRVGGRLLAVGREANQNAAYLGGPPRAVPTDRLANLVVRRDQRDGRRCDMPDPNIPLQDGSTDRASSHRRFRGVLGFLVRWGKTLIEDDGRYVVAQRIARRRVARCAKTRRVWAALIAIQAALYLAIGGGFYGLVSGIESARRRLAEVQREGGGRGGEPDPAIMQPPDLPPDGSPPRADRGASAIASFDAGAVCGRQNP